MWGRNANVSRIIGPYQLFLIGKDVVDAARLSGFFLVLDPNRRSWAGTYRSTRHDETYMHSWIEGWSTTVCGSWIPWAYLVGSVTTVDISFIIVMCESQWKRERIPYSMRAIAGYTPMVRFRMSMYSCTLHVNNRGSCMTLTCSSKLSKYSRCVFFHRCRRSVVVLASYSWGAKSGSGFGQVFSVLSYR